MTPELWEKVSAALDRLLELDPAEQAPFLERLRRDDPSTAVEVESLFEQQPGGLLETLPQPLRQKIESTRIRSGGVVVPSSAAETAPLRTVGRYLIQEEIARGGMGAILRALDPDFGRILAVKILLPQARADVNAEKRFLQEAKITGCLQHPGIPPIHELGRLDDGTPFFAMKLIEGKTLSALVTERSGAEMDHGFIGIFEQVCRTLAYAHSQRILHRDLKPSNVMVGAFGEVQVMDWGLAKTLSKPLAASESVTRTPHADATAVSQGIDSFSLAGDVMGTPAYMAPEQARGEIDRLDERCDVFGLGGILCAMLVGRPPFIGSVTKMVRQSSAGDLTETFAELDRREAEPELVAIAKKCLAPNPEDRYRDGAAVADAVTQYRESVRDKLAQAELARAKAQVQAEEERRRRRLSLSLFAAVLALVGIAGGAGFWYQAEQQRQRQEQAERELNEAKRLSELTATKDQVSREVRETLAAAEKLREVYQNSLADPAAAAALVGDLNRWETLLNDYRGRWRQANAAVSGHRALLDAELLGRVDAFGKLQADDETQFARARKLDEIRLSAIARSGGWFDQSRVGQAYAEFFRDELQVNPLRDDAERAAEVIRQSPIRFALLATLDHWLFAQQHDAESLARLAATVQRADPNPVRNSLRNQQLWLNKTEFQRQVDALDPAAQPPPFLTAIATRLSLSGGDSTPILRAAVVRHPRDFWLNLELGLKLSEAGAASAQPGEAPGYLQAALAVRPASPVVYAALGNALAWHQDHAGAVEAYRRAVELDPDFADAICNLGIALRNLDKDAEAIAAFGQALERMDYKNDRLAAWVHYNMGLARMSQNDFAGAKSSLQKSAALDPSPSNAYYRLGVLMMNHDDEAGAVPMLQKSLQTLDPGLHARAGHIHYLLGAVHHRNKDYPRAIATYRTAIGFDPTFSEIYYEMGKSLLALGDLPAAKAAFEAGLARVKDVERYPGPDLHLNLANTLDRQGEFTAAREEHLQWRHSKGWSDPAGKALEVVERHLALDGLYPALERGEFVPEAAADYAEWAEFCAAHKQLPVAGVKFYREAWERDRTLLEKSQYPATIAAVAAAAGDGRDAESLDAAGRAEYRSLALTWLQDQLGRLEKKLNLPKFQQHLYGETRRWEWDPRLATVREPEHLEKLAEDEQRAWNVLWTRAAELGPDRLVAHEWPADHRFDGRSAWRDYQLHLWLPKETRGRASAWNTTPIRGDFEAEVNFHLQPWTKEPPDNVSHFRFFAASQPGHHAQKQIMLGRHRHPQLDGFRGYALADNKWKVGVTVAHPATDGTMRIRRRGQMWETFFQPRLEETWISLGQFQFDQPEEIYLGVSLGIDDGTTVGQLNAVVSRVHVVQESP